MMFTRKSLNKQRTSKNIVNEDVKILMKPPFDKPYSFIKMFDSKTRNAILLTIESIKNNALQVVA